MDVTSDTVTAGSMLNGTTATKNDGTKATGTIASKSSSDLTASGATVTAPAGYYSSNASKSVTTMTLPTSASSSATSGYTSKATFDRSTSDRYLNIAPGYNSAGGYYKISKVANGTVTAPSSISGSSATISTGTNTLTLSKTVSVTPSVTTAGYVSSGTAGDSSVSLSASVTVNPTPTASGATVTVPAGYYSSQTTKSVSSGSAKPASSISATGATVSTGTNTLTLSKSVSNTPQVTAGYVSSGTAGNSSVSLTATVNTRSSSDLTVSGATVTAPAGYYSSAATKTISSGTEGTPAINVGALSHGERLISSSVTNTAGYISGSTKTSETTILSCYDFVSGSMEITENGTYDVAGSEEVMVNVASSSNLTSLNLNPDSVGITYYPDGNMYTLIEAGGYTSNSNGTAAYFTNRELDILNLKRYVPYQVNGELTIYNSTTGTTSYVTLDGITYTSKGEQSSLDFTRIPFTYTGADLLSYIYVQTTSTVLVAFKTTGSYQVTATSDITYKEIGYRDSGVNTSPTNYNDAISIPSGVPNGLQMSISGMYDGYYQSHIRGVFDERFTWDGDTHTFYIKNINTGDNIAYVTVTTSTIQCTAIETTSRNRYFGVDLSSYESYDGFSYVVLTSGVLV